MHLLVGINLDFILNLLLFIVSLGVLVTIHECGHFITAKIFGVYCQEFSIGFGPVLFKKKVGETQYSVRALPLGGYVSMAGEGMEDCEELKTLPPERFLTGIKKWKRAIIMVAGVFLNFVLALFLFIGYLASTPQLNKTATNLLTYRDTEDKIGLLEQSGYQGENITSITYDYDIPGLDKTVIKEENLIFEVKNGTSLTNALNGGYYTTTNNKNYYFQPTAEGDTKTINIYVEGKTEPYAVVVHSYALETSGESSTYAWGAINAKRVTYRPNFFQVIGGAFGLVGESSILILKSLIELFTPAGIGNLGGPIAVFQVSAQAAKQGFGAFVFLWGLISVNLGVFNLLPFPGLDGWHFLVIIVESITKKEMPSKVKSILSAVGLLLLFGLMIAVSVKDVIGLF